MFLILFRNILCPQQMFPSLRSPRNIMDNNVSSFTRAFKDKVKNSSWKSCKASAHFNDLFVHVDFKFETFITLSFFKYVFKIFKYQV